MLPCALAGEHPNVRRDTPLLTVAQVVRLPQRLHIQDGTMRSTRSLFLALALMGALAACADDATAPESVGEEVDATSDVLALAEGLGLPGTNTDRETGAVPTGLTRLPCRYSEESGRWVCAPVTREGLTFIRSFGYVDADGNPMRRFDPLLTAAANMRNAVHGTLQRDNTSIRIRSAGEMTVSGLLGQETTHILDGREVGAREIERVTDEGTSSSRVQFTNQTIAVVIPLVPRTDRTSTARRWPLSGRVVRAHIVTVTRGGETNTERWRETTTFNGTALVPVEIVGSRGTRSCIRNLETGELRCESER